MMWLVLLTLFVLGIATYLSMLNYALIRMSRAGLQRKLNQKGKPAAADWLHDQHDAAILATALFRTLARMTIYVLVIAALIGLRAEATITWAQLIGGGLIAAVGIWLTTSVIGTVVATHVGVAIIACSLPLLYVLTLVARPLTKLGDLTDRICRRWVGTRDPESAEDEFLQSIEDSQREGALDVQSAEILENVVEFTNTEVSQVMTPRSEIEGIEYSDNLDPVREFILHAGHSRIPVYKGTVDNIVGILYLKDLIRYLGEEPENFRLSEFLRQPIVVPETKPVRELLSVFQHGEVHMAMVVDEFGSIAGLVTIEDVLEEIVGDIRDEHEPIEDDRPQFTSLDDTRAEVDGRYRIDELNERMHLKIPENGDYDTLAGFMVSRIGRVPETGESIDCCNARFTTLASTPTHVQRVGIELLQRATADREEDRWDQAAK